MGDEGVCVGGGGGGEGVLVFSLLLTPSVCGFEFVYMKMKVEFWCISRPSHTFVFWPDSHI